MDEIATFGGGCFWGVEARFREYKGVIATRVGYAGGSKENPSYEEVCKSTTGHAESVEIRYDPNKLSYDDLLDIFFEIHDPTQVNRQGPDVGTQYRTVIFYHSEDQKSLAEKKIQVLMDAKVFNRPIATHVIPAVIFWEAEEYHQQYNEKHDKAPCTFTLERKKK